MMSRFTLLYAASLVLGVIFPQRIVSQTRPGTLVHTIDVGPVLYPGKTVYDETEQSYYLSGAGSNIWFAKDEFHYAYGMAGRDFILHTRGRFPAEGMEPHRKFGWMVRERLDTNAAMVCAAVHGDGLTSLQYRKKTGMDVEEVKSPIHMPDVIQLERRGRSFFLSVAQSGHPFWTVELPDIELPDSVYAGLFVCSHNKEVIETAAFDNVRMIIPAPADFRPYQDYLGSHLEVVEVQTGKRKLLYSTPEVIQAPNWTLDGKSLIYNKNGLLYLHDIASGAHTLIPTSPVNANNNDHVLSFDGKMIGLSGRENANDDGSLLYTVPIEGGVPVKVDVPSPSYLHGWSPDGKWLVYTGERNGDYDIYKVPVEGGAEVRLTDTPGLDDGPEYSPDGKYIFYNSVRSGKMEIWRMTADGKESIQLTDDAYQNWFPHVSPDGKQLVFLSYPPEVAADDHPYYQRIYLRMVSCEGGNAKVIAYVFGGQGTINVPSWSPDGKYVAFVSNSGM